MKKFVLSNCFGTTYVVGQNIAPIFFMLFAFYIVLDFVKKFSCFSFCSLFCNVYVEESLVK